MADCAENMARKEREKKNDHRYCATNGNRNTNHIFLFFLSSFGFKKPLEMNERNDDVTRFSRRDLPVVGARHINRISNSEF